MLTCIFAIFFYCLIIHGNNDLLTKGTFHSHIDLRFCFVLDAIDNFLNLINFLVLKFWEHLFDFESVYRDVIVLRYKRSLSIRLLLWVVILLEKLWDVVYFFRLHCQNQRRKRRYVSRFDLFLIFIVNRSFDNLRIKFGLDFTSEQYIGFVHIKAIPMCFIKCWKKISCHFANTI